MIINKVKKVNIRLIHIFKINLKIHVLNVENYFLKEFMYFLFFILGFSYQNMLK
jgi:hypothetical protein